LTFSQKLEEIKRTTLIAGLHEQIREELAGVLEVPKELERMIHQKYGLIPPQFTNKERKVIQREDRRERR
jgi:2-iminoacetate synthase ThiH